MPESHRCPQCHAELPADAPDSVCPRCVLQFGFGDRSAETAGRLLDAAAAKPMGQRRTNPAFAGINHALVVSRPIRSARPRGSRLPFPAT